MGKHKRLKGKHRKRARRLYEATALAWSSPAFLLLALYFTR